MAASRFRRPKAERRSLKGLRMLPKKAQVAIRKALRRKKEEATS